MTEASEAKLATIRALLAKAEDSAASREEAEVFMAKAIELMAKYGVDRAVLAASDPSTDSVGDRVITVSAPYVTPKLTLLAAIADALRVRTVRRRDGDKLGADMHLFGMGSDLERVELLFTSLLVQAARFQSEDERVDPMAKIRPKAWRNAYLYGYTERVYKRLKEIEDQAIKDASGSADIPAGSMELVLVSRADQVARRVAETYPKTQRARSTRVDKAGMDRGKTAGNRADLGQARFGGTHRRGLGS